jgi:prepilin-type N-terminal cleavage/methylation domain-containing protein
MKLLINKKPVRNTERGFTLIEMLVSLAIFVIVTGLVVGRYSNYNSGILLTNLAYEVALSVRQSQNNALNVREYNGPLGATFNAGYGVHFDMADSKMYRLFADMPTDTNNPSTGNRHYCPTTSCDGEVDPIITAFAINRGSYIKRICVEEDGGVTTTCSPSITRLDVVFIRPSPEAIIATTDSGGSFRENVDASSGTYANYTSAEIVIAAPDGKEKRVVIKKTGQIAIPQN